MKEACRILYASSEVVPFAATGGLGEVAASLPYALSQYQGSALDIRLIMPYYRSVKKRWADRASCLGSLTVPIGQEQKPMRLFCLSDQRIPIYLVENDAYFDRENLYGYEDDIERFVFFSRAVMMASALSHFVPHLIHANDWQTAMIPVYQKTIRGAEAPATVFTIHNIEYQGRHDRRLIRHLLGLPADKEDLVEYQGDLNLMKGGIVCCDALSTVSPTYMRELEEEENAFGLAPVIRQNRGKACGILNGIDTRMYDPGSDPSIIAPYSSDDLSGKARCRRALLEELSLTPANLDRDRTRPVIAMVGRLVYAKGLDLVLSLLEDLLRSKTIFFVLLGSGDDPYKDFFLHMQKTFPDRVRACFRYDPGLARRIYAGSDMLLMPSKSEPCGLSQMIAMRYGTLPIVRKTGGLADSVTDAKEPKGTGFLFRDFTPDALRETISRALSSYADRKSWEEMMQRDMNLDVSWRPSSKAYVDVYRKAKCEKQRP